MEEKTQKEKKTKKKVREADHEPERGTAYEQEPAKNESLSVNDVLERMLPIVSLVLAFTAVVLFYRKFMPQPKQADATETALTQEQQSLLSTNQSGYTGLEDKWLSDEGFTTGNVDLDYQVKFFCDALSYEDYSAAENAQSVFNTIVWSTVEERTEDQKPTGEEWAIVAAKHYFSGGIPEEGVGGTGDEYEFSAAVSYCLQYFGFKDAWAIPILRGSAATGQTSGAVVLVTNEDGKECVCDFQYGEGGWMLDRESYPITVEDIGQDLTKAEDMGLRVKMAPSIDVNGTTSSSSHTRSSANGLVNDSSDDSVAETTDAGQSSYDYSGGYSDSTEYGNDYSSDYSNDYSSDYSSDYSGYDDTYGY